MLDRIQNTLRALGNPHLLRLCRYLAAYRTLIIVAVGCMFAAGASSSLIALLLGKLTDLGFYEQQRWVVLGAPIALVGIAALHGSCMFLSNYLLGKASQNVLKTLRAEIFARMLHWPQATYQENPTGMVASRFVFEANFALTNATKATITLVRDTVQVLALTVMLFWHNALLALISLILAPAVVWLLRFINRRMKGVMNANQTSLAELLVRVKEAYRAERVIKLAGSYERECARFAAVNQAIRQAMVDMTKITALGAPLTQMLCMSAIAVVFMAAMYQTQQGLLTVGQFVTFLAALLLILPPLKHLAGLNASFVMMGMSAQSLFALLDLPPERDEGRLTLGPCRRQIEFAGVSLTYPHSRAPALTGITFTVRAGQCLALVGASGSGKSSLMSLLPRFWHPTAGTIRIDGIDIADVSLASLRHQIAIVSQEVFLFDASIAANLRYGCPQATEAELWRALEDAALADWVRSLPLGLEAPVGEAGGLLSGGQKQRLAIARAFLKNAPILILDEATSALDSVTEHVVQQSLTRLKQGRTTFLIAHRFSSLGLADVIAVLDQGRLVEWGTQTELLARHGLFARLYRLQQLGVAA